MATWEENSSYTYLHPGLKLRGPSEADLEQYHAWNEWMAKFQAQRQASKAQRQARQPATGLDLNTRFPVQVLGRILRNLLVFDGQPIHVVSRLDPHYEPGPGLVNGSLRLLNRFHIGNASFSLTCEMPPQVLLAPLSVCKQWNYIGSNLFYSLNHFCFSSLLWIGNQEVCNAPTKKRGKYISRRTQPLMYLPESIRLKHIEIYIRESDPFYMRRKHEPRGAIRFLKGHTITQPDFRLFRDMKTIQGGDYIWCLRGLYSMRLYDYDFYIKGGKTTGLRNHNFIGLLNEVTTRQKAPEKERLAKFENLAPLCGYLPRNHERRWIEKEVTTERERDGDRLEYEPESEPDEDEAPPSGPDDQHGLTPGFHGGNGENDNDDSDDDNDRGRNHRPDRRHGRNSPRRVARTTGPASVAGPSDDDVLMSDAPQRGEQSDEEMSDEEMSVTEHGDDVDTAMVNTDLNETTHTHGSSSYNVNANADAPPPSPCATRRSRSSDLYIDGHGGSGSGPSPARHMTPGLPAQGSYRFPPSVSPVSENSEGSMFVRSDRDTTPIKIDVEGAIGAVKSRRSAPQQSPGPAHVAQRLREQSWEKESSSDSDDENDDGDDDDDEDDDEEEEEEEGEDGNGRGGRVPNDDMKETEEDEDSDEQDESDDGEDQDDNDEE
ncbi:hypothetical protein HC256_007036 [Beauveria bassiana]|nr:hypothetical protein HC256_007036 [Beauveria bassiana]